jgi:hypothetical protein
MSPETVRVRASLEIWIDWLRKTVSLRTSY